MIEYANNRFIARLKNTIIYAPTDIVRHGLIHILESTNVHLKISSNHTLIIIEDFSTSIDVKHTLEALKPSVELSQKIIFILSTVPVTQRKFHVNIVLHPMIYLTLFDNLAEIIHLCIEQASHGIPYFSPQLTGYIFAASRNQLALLDTLTARQEEIIYLLYTGLSANDIAEIAQISRDAIYKILQRLRKKFDANSNRLLLDTLLQLGYKPEGKKGK